MTTDQYSIAGLAPFSGIGKSALIIRYARGEFVELWDPVIEDVYRKTCVIDGGVVILDVLDTARPDEHGFGTYLAGDVRTNEGFILVYSITSRPSFGGMKTIYQDIIKIKGQDSFPMVLVATQCDSESRRQVSKNEGQELARQFGCPFFETSAKENINVDEPFSELVREIRRYRNEPISSSTELGTEEQSSNWGCCASIKITSKDHPGKELVYDNSLVHGLQAYLGLYSCHLGIANLTTLLA